MANSPRAVATIGCADLVAAGGEVGDWTLISHAANRAGATPAQDILTRAILTSIFVRV